MARKLSGLAWYGCWIVIALYWTSAVDVSCARGQVRVSSPPVVLPNPFASGASEPQPVAVEPEAPRLRPTTYQNPFAHMQSAPPIEMPVRPGPVSRWRRPVLPDEPSRVKTAILSAEAPRTSGTAWNQLPPIEELVAANAARQKSNDPVHTPEQGSSIRFAPQSLAQPAWVTQPIDAIQPSPPTDEAAASESINNDPFDVPINEAPVNESQPSTIDLTPAPIELPPSPIELPPPATITDGLPEAQKTPSPPGNVNLLPMVISDYSDSPEGWFAQAQQLAQTAESIDELAKIIELCQQALAQAPPTELAGPLRRLAGWAHNRCGELQIEQGLEAEAVRNFQVAISLDPNCSLAVHNRAVTLAQRNETEAALRDFNRVIELNPGLSVAYRNRAELLASLGRFNEAVSDYTRAIDGLPEVAELYRARGIALQRLGMFERAVADLDHAIQLAPNDADAYTQRGNLAAESGEFERAASDLRRAIEINPKWADAYRSLAWLHATCPDAAFRDPQQAIAAAEEAAKLSPPTDCFALDALAVAHASAGNFENAARLTEQAIASAPPDYVELLRQRLNLYQQGQPFINQPAGAVRAASHETQINK
jgi:tetratricopeptide (TPR) repeat protein